MVQGVPPAGRRSQLLRVHGEINGVLKGHGREPTRDALGDSGAMNDSLTPVRARAAHLARRKARSRL